MNYLVLLDDLFLVAKGRVLVWQRVTVFKIVPLTRIHSPLFARTLSSVLKPSQDIVFLLSSHIFFFAFVNYQPVFTEVVYNSLFLLI